MTIEIHGVCDPRFEPLKTAFAANFDDGLELGASVAVTHQGRTVADLWAGWADPEKTVPWDRDTIVPVASTTKIMVAVSALRLVDQGLLDLDAPLSAYWPDFAQGGKAHVTVREAFSHQAGVPGFDPPIDPDLTFDWDAVTARVAAEPHWFGGRRKICYHAHTYGFILGELIRRVDGRGPRQYFREEIARPAGADFQLGLTDQADVARLASLMPPPPLLPASAFPPGALAARYFASFATGHGLRGFGTPSWEELAREHPSIVGLGNGRSIARVCAILAMNGELDGVRYISPATVAEAGRTQGEGVDIALGPLRMGLGFGLHSEHFPAPTPTCMHWGGTGGSMGLADPATGVSFGYAPNNWSLGGVSREDPRLRRLLNALQSLLPTL